jgi:uncharacterized phage infection (PIP) family protein YhgE
MDKDGKIRPLSLSDIKEVSERDERITQLEQLNSLLAEQIDRMDKVIKIARQWHNNDKGFTRIALHNALDQYDAKMKQMAKEVE